MTGGSFQSKRWMSELAKKKQPKQILKMYSFMLLSLLGHCFLSRWFYQCVCVCVCVFSRSLIPMMGAIHFSPLPPAGCNTHTHTHTHTLVQLSAWALTWLTGRKNSFTKLHLPRLSRCSSREWDRKFETEGVKITGERAEDEKNPKMKQINKTVRASERKYCVRGKRGARKRTG